MQDFQSELMDLASEAWRVVFQPWTIYQILIIGVAFGLSWLLSKRLEPPLESWVRGLKINVGFLRLFAVLLRRIDWILFVLFTAIANLIVSGASWPSHAFFIKLEIGRAHV